MSRNGSQLLFAVALSGAGLAACGEEVKVSVECRTTAAPAVECDVVETLGKAEVEVCWDFQVECANGALVKASHTCQKVKDGGTVKVTIPREKLEGLDKCGGSGPPKGTLSNMTLDGKASN